MGGIIYNHARNRQCHTILVGTPVERIWYLWLMLESKLLNEIMPMIYKRFTEKAAEEWRQIYKVNGDELSKA